MSDPGYLVGAVRLGLSIVFDARLPSVAISKTAWGQRVFHYWVVLNGCNVERIYGRLHDSVECRS